MKGLKINIMKTLKTHYRGVTFSFKENYALVNAITENFSEALDWLAEIGKTIPDEIKNDKDLTAAYVGTCKSELFDLIPADTIDDIIVEACMEEESEENDDFLLAFSEDEEIVTGFDTWENGENDLYEGCNE